LPDEIIKEMQRFQEADLEASSDDNNFQDMSNDSTMEKLNAISNLLNKVSPLKKPELE
jgi:hypothetical protein